MLDNNDCVYCGFVFIQVFFSFSASVVKDCFALHSYPISNGLL